MAIFDVFGMRIYFNVYAVLLVIIPVLVFFIGQLVAYKAKKPKTVIILSLIINTVLLGINVYFAKSGMTMDAAKAGLVIIAAEVAWLLAFKGDELKKFYERLHSDKNERKQAISLCIAVLVICVVILPLIGALARI